MTDAAVTLNGVTYRGDHEHRTIEPLDDTSTLALYLMTSREPIGPQVDEFAGVFGTWAHYPRSMVAAFMDIAAADDTDLSWFSTSGEPPPAPPPQGA